MTQDFYYKRIDKRLYDAYGLLRFYYFPGRTPYVYVRKRLNVVSLAIATDPDCLRPELTKRDEWERLYQVLVDKRSLRKLKTAVGVLAAKLGLML